MRMLPVLILFALAACRDGAADDDSCGAAGYSALIGAQLAAVTLPSDLMHRVVGPDDAVTMDHRPERLNIRVNEAGVITGLDCG